MTILLVLTALFPLLCFAAGGSEGAATDEDLTEISVLVWDRGTTPGDMGTVQENWYTDFVTENVAEFGVKPVFVPIPRAEERQLLPTMLAAGNAPDVSYTYNRTLINRYVSDDALIDFTDLFNEYSVNIKAKFSERDLQAGMFEGKMYTFRFVSNGSAGSAWIRKDWLDKLGMEEPETIDELYEVLKAFKEKDPGNVGDALMPFALPKSRDFWNSQVMCGFTTEPPGPEKILMPSIMWPEAKETVRWLNKLYHEGLYGDLTLDKNDDLFKEKIRRGEIGVFTHHYHAPWLYKLYEPLEENVPGAELTGIHPFHQEGKPRMYAFYGGLPYGYFYFSAKTTKNPDKVMQYLDWLASEECMMTTGFGVEGKDYTLDSNGVPQIIDMDSFSKRVSWVKPQYNLILNPFAKQEDVFFRLEGQSMGVPERHMDEFLENASVEPYSEAKYPAVDLLAERPVNQKYWPTLDKMEKETLPTMMFVDPNEFDEKWDAFVKKYREQGGVACYEENIEVYRRLYNY
jgi:putative aldouronate transport system substrate-binding protein